MEKGVLKVQGGFYQVAEQVLKWRWGMEGMYGLLRTGEEWWAYREDERGIERWGVASKEWVFNEVSKALAGAKEVVYSEKGGKQVTEEMPYRVTTRNVGEVVAFVGVLVSRDVGGVLGWLGNGKCPVDLEDCVFFDDVVVEVGKTARRLMRGEKKVWVTRERTPEYFAPCVVGCAWNPKAACERWERCLKEWWGREWRGCARLREEFYGGCLRKKQPLRRVLEEFGKSRGGKSLGPRLLALMLGAGDTGVFSLRVGQLTESKHVLNHMEKSRCVVVTEMGRMNKVEQSRVMSLAKGVMGEDLARDERKYRDPGSVVGGYGCALVFQGNSLPALDDEQGALLGRVLPLHYKRSFLGKEEEGLFEVLEGELPGIAARWLRALVRQEVRVMEGGQRWVLPESSMGLLARMRAHNNVADAFLECHFVHDEKWWVDNRVVREEREKFERATGLMVKVNGRRVSDQNLPKVLVERTSWTGVERARRDGERGIVGLKKRIVPQYFGLVETRDVAVRQ